MSIGSERNQWILFGLLNKLIHALWLKILKEATKENFWNLEVLERFMM